jgi:hypothetical protein
MSHSMRTTTRKVVTTVLSGESFTFAIFGGQHTKKRKEHNG